MGRRGIPSQVRREFWQQIRTGLPIFKAAQAEGVPITTAQTWYLRQYPLGTCCR